MNILIALGHNRLTGVSTFCYTLAQRLKQVGHNISFFLLRRETNNNLFENQCLQIGPIYNHLNPPINDYDVIFFSDNLCQTVLKKYTGQKMFIIHGFGESTFVPNLNEEIDLISISPFLTRYYTEKYKDLNIKVTYFPNIIDFNLYFIKKPISSTLKKVLIHDYRSGMKYKTIFEDLSKELKFELNIHCSPNEYIWNMCDIINDHDLVIGYGRSIYEAMACGRNIIVFGKNGGDGFIDEFSFNESFDRNCSGWGIHNLEAPIIGGDNNKLKEKLRLELLKYSPNLSDKIINLIKNSLSL